MVNAISLLSTSSVVTYWSIVSWIVMPKIAKNLHVISGTSIVVSQKKKTKKTDGHDFSNSSYGQDC